MTVESEAYARRSGLTRSRLSQREVAEMNARLRSLEDVVREVWGLMMARPGDFPQATIERLRTVLFQLALAELDGRDE